MSAPTSPVEGEDETFEYPSDSYSSQLNDVLGDSEEEHDRASDGSDDEFVYTGQDAAQGGYREQLSEVLGVEAAELEDAEDERQVQRHLLRDISASPIPSAKPLAVQNQVHEKSPSTLPIHSKLLRSTFLHPTVSRLRSFVPKEPHMSNESVASSFAAPNFQFDAPSHFSSISRSSSVTNILEMGSPGGSSNADTTHARLVAKPKREPFRWTALKNILIHVRTPPSAAPQKAAKILGGFLSTETPTVMATNGLVCVGTNQGRVHIFDFKQQLRSTCSTQNAKAVSAVALSQDHTFVAVGHVDGCIYLYDLSSPQQPVRSVHPTTLAGVASGRREGHLTGSRITHLGFVGARHTAIVSVDENGLAFYHSLGKVLFVEASDVLRILGKYPEEEEIVAPAAEASLNGQPSPPAKSGKAPARRTKWSRQSASITNMSSLPLGTNRHPTDSYNIIALITTLKLVVVALKPSPKTWLRRRRGAEDRYAAVISGETTPHVGCLAWFPSVTLPNDDPGSKVPPRITLPTLAYSWDKTVQLVTVREERVKTLRKGERRNHVEEQGHLVFEDAGAWATDEIVHALHWLNARQLVIATTSHLEVWDIRDGCKRVEKAGFNISKYIHSILDIDGALVHSYEHTLKTYKGKIFLLGPLDITVGTLLSWSDHILDFVDRGDTLGAIEIATAYHLGTAEGSQDGLPVDPPSRKRMTGQRLQDLMTASVRHAFSPDRFKDDTHRTTDNRGVDRTDLFRGLVPICVHGCIALGSFDFIFEDLFESYDENGIAPIFLERLEPFLLDDQITSIPPWITQRLIALHEEYHEFDKAEALVWHLDPMSLDINQAIRLCKQRKLWDALIYVYTRALRDYISPIVELLGLVREVQKLRIFTARHGLDAEAEAKLEDLAPNAYKIFPYIAATLSGQAFPSQKALPAVEASNAKADIYAFLFDGRSRLWPSGPDGKLVLTTEEEGGIEPTYPYLRLLLRFDPESLLHTLDIAFEDSYLNDDNQGMGRLVIVKILLEMLNAPHLSSADATFIRIFLARNVPKYPQFIRILPSFLHSVLVGLAMDPDSDTREDRQLAAECLLSSYTPHEGDKLLQTFEEAGFYRILRHWRWQEKQWVPLVKTYFDDPEITTANMFSSLNEVLSAARNKTRLPTEVVQVVLDALPQLLENDVVQTALMMDKYLSNEHHEALKALKPTPTLQFRYLRSLLQPQLSEIDGTGARLPKRPSKKIDETSKQLFFSLLCRYDPAGVTDALETLPPGAADWTRVVPVLKENRVHDAVLWALDVQGKSGEVFDALAEAYESEARELSRLLNEGTASGDGIKAGGPRGNFEDVIERLQRTGSMGIRLCEKASLAPDDGVPPQSRWLQLLRSQVYAIQAVFTDTEAGERAPSVFLVVKKLRALVHESLNSLLLHASSQHISFPRLFKELVTSTAEHDSITTSNSKALYAEFRLILTGMLETYRHDGELLKTTNALISRDLFDTIENWTRMRTSGWRASLPVCGKCGESLLNAKVELPAEGDEECASAPALRVHGSGQVYHVRCVS